MKLQPLARLVGACFGLAVLTSSVRADDGAAAAKKIFTELQDSVLWVSTVAKISVNSESARDGAFNLPDREQKQEALGTVIDVSGLTVTALSSIDPSKELSGREVRTRGGAVKLEASAILKEVKIILPDGTEVPAEVVMRDADLDLAFLRPKAGSKEVKEAVFKPVELKKGASGDVTDDVVTLSRMDEILNRQPAVTRGQIIAVTKKPREFMRATGVSSGCPTFLPDGRLLGIATQRSVKGKGSMMVLIPAEDVREVADQAMTARAETPDESKPAETTGDKEKP